MPNTNKWITITEYVDLTTGEVLHYLPVNTYVTQITHLPTEYGTTYNIKRIRKCFRENQQQSLEFGTHGTKTHQ